MGLRGGSDAPSAHVHAGDVFVRAFGDGVRVRTDRATYAPEAEAAFLLAAGGTTPSEPTTVVPVLERLDVRSGAVVVESAATKASVGGGSALAVARDGEQAVAVLDEARWTRLAPQEPTCTPDQALRLVARVRGVWRGEPRNASITVGDDGRWHGYERHPGRSETKAGSWEPRPGGTWWSSPMSGRPTGARRPRPTYSATSSTATAWSGSARAARSSSTSRRATDRDQVATRFLPAPFARYRAASALASSSTGVSASVG